MHIQPRSRPVVQLVRRGPVLLRCVKCMYELRLWHVLLVDRVCVVLDLRGWLLFIWQCIELHELHSRHILVHHRGFYECILQGVFCWLLLGGSVDKLHELRRGHLFKYNQRVKLHKLHGGLLFRCGRKLVHGELRRRQVRVWCRLLELCGG